jgi:hypothetical protein
MLDKLDHHPHRGAEPAKRTRMRLPRGRNSSDRRRSTSRPSPASTRSAQSDNGAAMRPRSVKRQLRASWPVLT